MSARSIFCERPLVCAVCGSAFIGNHPRSKYCSPKCGSDAARQKQNAKRALNPDHFRAVANRTYARNREAVIAKSREYGHSDRGRELQRLRSARRRVTEKEKIGARTALNNAIRDGRVVRGTCRDCGAPEAHGHHHDYSKPLDVIWLCTEHHIAEHRRIDDGC